MAVGLLHYTAAQASTAAAGASDDSITLRPHEQPPYAERGCVFYVGVLARGGAARYEVSVELGDAPVEVSSVCAVYCMHKNFLFAYTTQLEVYMPMLCSALYYLISSSRSMQTNALRSVTAHVGITAQCSTQTGGFRSTTLTPRSTFVTVFACRQVHT
jgi:hypothetical protein